MQALQAGAASYVPKRTLEQTLLGTVERVLVASRIDRRRQRFLECVTALDAHFSLDNDPALVPVMVNHVQEYVVRMGLCDENAKVRFGIALEEALLNGLFHGNLGLPSPAFEDGERTHQRLAEERRRLAPYSDRRLHVDLHLEPHQARIVIRDDGAGFDVSTLCDPTLPENLLQIHGRGLMLIRLFMTEARHNALGNEVTLVYRP